MATIDDAQAHLVATAADATPASPAPDRTRGSHREVLVCCGAGLTTLIESAAVSIAMPAIRTSLGADQSQIQWILASYSLTFGIALVPAGRLGDVWGRRNLFLWGVAIFVVGAVISGCSSSPWPVIAARLIQGTGAGIISSQVLGIIADRFVGAERARALAAYGVAVGLAGVAGPAAAGTVLTALGPGLGWRLSVLLSAPVAVVTFIAAAVVLRRDHVAAPARRAKSVDLVGLALISAATLLVLLPIVSSLGTWLSAGSVALAVAALVGFFWWERVYARRGGGPVLVPALASSRGYLLGAAIAMFYFGASTSVNTVVTMYLIERLHLPPLVAALLLIGGSAAMSASSAVAWRFVQRYGRAVVVVALSVQCVVVPCDLLALATLPRAAAIAAVVALSLASGTAMGLVDAPNRALTLEYAPPDANGVAAGFLQLVQRLSATIALAGVSGLYLSSAGTGWSLTTPLAVCAAMFVAALALSVADLRRRR